MAPASNDPIQSAYPPEITARQTHYQPADAQIAGQHIAAGAGEKVTGIPAPARQRQPLPHPAGCPHP